MVNQLENSFAVFKAQARPARRGLRGAACAARTARRLLYTVFTTRPTGGMARQDAAYLKIILGGFSS